MLYCFACIFVACGLPVSFLVYFAIKNSQQLIVSIAGAISWLVALSIISTTWIFLPFSDNHYLLVIYSFMFNEIFRFATLTLMMFLSKKLDEIRMVGLGLGVGSALCQVLIHNVPYLTLSSGDADLYELNSSIGNFTVVAYTGFCYSLYIICSYSALALILSKSKKESIFCIVFVILHALFLLSAMSNTYISVYLGILSMLVVDIITLVLTFFIFYKYRG